MIGNNNCLNIRSSKSFKWLGQTGATRGFCDFESIDYCIRAGAYLIMRSYRRAGCRTLDQIIRRWAPPSENDTTNYIYFVCSHSSLKRHDEIDTVPKVARLLSLMQIMEVGNLYRRSEKIEEIIDRFHLKFIV